ncbi:protogenin-like [Pecten maximus]|uniref:protogenin-like n=1 Tax=Pecten maximus TaxID=6579 RepID=UPI0014580DEB|nr:protogenin-like [Pecten maximus]
MAALLLYFVAVCTIIVLDLPVQGIEVGLAIDTGIGVLNRQDSQHVIAQKNWKLLLNCSVTSSPRYGLPTITWLKNGVPLNLDNRISKTTNGSLFFRKVVNKRKRNITDEGLYDCLASNSKGTVLARRVKLEISGISGKFSRQPEDETVEEGAVARFQCNIRASPPPLYTWLKDDEHLNNDDRHIIISTGILQILDVNAVDAGQYWCKATPGKLHDLPDQVDSIKWKKSSPATLTVNPGTGRRRLAIKSGPVNTTVQEGQSVVLECLVDGYPKPQVTWERDDGSDVTMAAVKYGFSNLKILQATSAHSGIYICRARSGGKDCVRPSDTLCTHFDASQVGLNKEVRRRKKLDYHLFTGIGGVLLARPVITQPPQSVQYVPAHSTRFECAVEGNPRPQVQWLRNGTKIMAAANHQIKENNDLVITGTVPQDSGYYQCVVENVVDYDMRIARLEIKPIKTAPLPPQGLHVQVLSATSMVIAWESNSQRPVLAYSLNIVNRDTGEKLNTNVIQGIHNERVDHLSPATTYEISVRAYNKNGASAFSDVEVVTTFEKEPSVAPMIRITKTTSTSITLEWDELPRKQRNGVIVGYKVFYQKDGETAIRTDEDNNGDSRSFIIKGLEPNTEYNVRMLARTSIGYPNLKEDRWPWVHDKTQPQSRQNDSVPDPPTLTVISLNASSVNITWHQDVPRVPCHHVLNETFYQVSLTASNQFGESGAVIEEFLTSENPPPPAPVNLHATFLASREISVEWSQPEFSLDILSYRVQYRPDRGSSARESFIITDTTRAAIVDLMPYTYYYIEVQASARSRKSKFSKSILLRTQEDEIHLPLNSLGSDLLETYLPLNSLGSDLLEIHLPLNSLGSDLLEIHLPLNSIGSDLLETHLPLNSLGSDLLEIHLPLNSLGSDLLEIHLPLNSLGSDLLEIHLPLNSLGSDLLEMKDPGTKHGNVGSALVHWDIPKFPNGNITTYIVRYRSQTENNWKLIRVNGSQNVAHIDNLKPGLYNVEVTACTSAGQGPRSKNSIHIIGVGEQSTAKPVKGSPHSQQLGIILGITIGVVCIIICILIILLRNKCFNNPPPGHPHVQAVRFHGNGHVPGQRNGHAVPVSDREMDPYTPMLDGHYENHLLDSKGCGSGNIIVTPNGTRVNGYVPFSNGLRNGHLHNGHVTTVIGYQNQQEETRGLIAAMLANDGNAVTEDLSHLYKLSSPDKTSLDDIDKSISGTDSDQNTSTGSADLPPIACCLDDGTTACCHDDDSGCHGDNSSCPLVGTYPHEEEEENVAQVRPPLEVDTQQGVRPPDPSCHHQRAASSPDHHMEEEGQAYSYTPRAQLPPRAMPTTSAFSDGEHYRNQSSTSVSPQHLANSTSTRTGAGDTDITSAPVTGMGSSEMAPQGTPTSGKGSPNVTPTHENTSSFQPNNLAPSVAVTVVRGNDNQSRPLRVQGSSSSSPRVPGVRGSYQQPPPPPYPGPRDLAMHRLPQDSLRRDHNSVAAGRQDVAV